MSTKIKIGNTVINKINTNLKYVVLGKRKDRYSDCMLNLSPIVNNVISLQSDIWLDCSLIKRTESI